jgi:hypothetical protein
MMLDLKSRALFLFSASDRSMFAFHTGVLPAGEAFDFSFHSQKSELRPGDSGNTVNER